LKSQREENGMSTKADEFDWLDDGIESGFTGLEKRAQVMRAEEQLGKDRIWFTDGDYIWFRRSKSNPATLERHNKFCAMGDYEHIETQGDIEVYKLRESSPFKTKDAKQEVVNGRQVDIGVMDNYNIRRQAALAACKRDWKAFQDIMAYLRERIAQSNQNPNAPGTVSPLADNIYAEQYLAVMEAINQRNGPSPGEINKELMALQHKTATQRQKIITFGQ
jgi:hypothetical protein